MYLSLENHVSLATETENMLSSADGSTNNGRHIRLGRYPMARLQG